jgi:cytochrome c
MKYWLPAVVILAMLLSFSACSSSTSPPSSSPVNTISATSSVPPTSSGPTFGQYSNSGRAIFVNKCSSCHGANGEGVTAPTLIGSGSNLGKYNTAQGLFDFMRTLMPFNAPGSLPNQDYQNLLAYLLVQNNLVTTPTAFDPGQLANIQLKK